MRHKGRAGILLSPGQSQIERGERERDYTDSLAGIL